MTAQGVISCCSSVIVGQHFHLFFSFYVIKDEVNSLVIKQTANINLFFLTSRADIIIIIIIIIRLVIVVVIVTNL